MFVVPLLCVDVDYFKISFSMETLFDNSDLVLVYCSLYLIICDCIYCS
jgi:hypothetical protein